MSHSNEKSSVQAVKDKNGIEVLTLDLPNFPMNVINEVLTRDLHNEFERIYKDESVKGMVIQSGKSDFVAGADLDMLRKITSVDECKKFCSALHEIFRKLEKWEKPVVACINGAALGGGYELCLATNYRIAIDQERPAIGLPEVTLGLLPGAGGTQRLPRIMGIQPSLQPLLEGKKFNPKKALAVGMIDEIATDKDDMLAKAKKWILANPKAVQPWDKDGYKIPGGKVQSPMGYMVFPASVAMITEKTSNNYPAPRTILSCVYEGLQVPFDQGRQIEIDYFATLATSPIAKNMIRTLFYGINENNKGASRPKGIPKAEFSKIGILGAGMMGAGIAYVTAKAGIKAILKDVSVENAEKGKAYSEKLLKKDIERKRSTEAKAKEILDLIVPTENPNSVEGCDLIIEAVFEDREIKAKVTKESEKVISKETVFASNTSTLPITGLAEASERPENFIGLHFFSPVDKMPLVEVIVGKKTSDKALALALDYVKKIKKTPIVVNDSRGFFTSRVFTTYVHEGVELLNEGVAPALIENAGKYAGMPVGALAVADEISLDLMYHILKQTKEDIGEEFISPVMEKVCSLFVNELKRPGKKGGKGFYDYPDKAEKGKKKRLWPGLATHFKPAKVQPPIEEVKKRLLHVQAVETAKVLEEKVLFCPRDGDVGSILGWGFAPFTGGALSYIDYVGVKKFVEDCDDFANRFGKRFKVPELLRKMAKNNEKFLS